MRRKGLSVKTRGAVVGRGESEQCSGWETSRRAEAPNRIWRRYFGGVNAGCHAEL